MPRSRRLTCDVCGCDSLKRKDTERVPATSKTGAVAQRRKYVCTTPGCEAPPAEFWLVCVGQSRTNWLRGDSAARSSTRADVITTVVADAETRRTSIVLSIGWPIPQEGAIETVDDVRGGPR
jgi:hypothetical protein